MTEMILTLHCPDQGGIVAKVASYIFQQGGNIISSKQHYEEIGHRFFMRVCFDITHKENTLEVLKQGFEKDVAKPYDMSWQLHKKKDKQRIAILVSKYDHCLYDLLLRHQYGELNAEVCAVISNHKALEPVAKHFNKPFFYQPISKSDTLQSWKKNLALFSELKLDLLVLARYMQILPDFVIEPYQHKIINVHHGFLPAFKGAKAYHQAYERGVKMIGATSHYATAELDDGPIIAQATLNVNHAHSSADMVRLGRDLESQVLSHAVCAHLEHRILLYKNRTVIF